MVADRSQSDAGIETEINMIGSRKFNVWKHSGKLAQPVFLRGRGTLNHSLPDSVYFLVDLTED